MTRILPMLLLALAACTSRQQAPILVEDPGRSGVVVATEDPSLEEGTRFAVDDLARRLAVPSAEIRVISATTVDWRSSAVGCPQPDHMYLTVLTPGYQIVLKARGAQYHYHGAEQGRPFLCPGERREPPAATTRVRS